MNNNSELLRMMLELDKLKISRTKDKNEKKKKKKKKKNASLVNRREVVEIVKIENFRTFLFSYSI